MICNTIEHIKHSSVAMTVQGTAYLYLRSSLDLEREFLLYKRDEIIVNSTWVAIYTWCCALLPLNP